MKKLTAFLLAAVLLLTGVFGVSGSRAATPYKVYTSVNKYLSADQAKRGVNSVGKYYAGTYYIYKSYAGMLNISKASGSPGAWINPSQNKAPTNTTTTQTTVSVSSLTIGQLIKTSVSTKAYSNATDALYRRNAVTSYAAGSYYVYKKYNGMLNISRKKGVPGAWINPVGLKITTNTTTVTKPTTPTSPTTPTAPTTTYRVGDVFTLYGSTPGYTNAADALARVNPKVTYTARNYYIYSIYKGMLNISRVKGSPGAWINPIGLKPAPEPTIPEPTIPEPVLTSEVFRGQFNGDKFNLNVRSAVYSNATDAINKVFSTKYYSKGTYYIYKTVPGAVNITRTAGAPGAWISTAVTSEKVTLYYPIEVSGKTEKGIDVSKWQGATIDWNKVKNSGVKFVMINLGHGLDEEGNLLKDPNFEINYAGATAAGLKVGAYYYSEALTGEEAIREADQCLLALNNRPLSMPLAFDIEDKTQLSLSRETMDSIVVNFNERIKSAGYNPMIYSMQEWLMAKLSPEVTSKYPLWVARYGSYLEYQQPYAMWQYSSKGKVEGVEVDGVQIDVDLNILFVK